MTMIVFTLKNSGKTITCYPVSPEGEEKITVDVVLSDIEKGLQQVSVDNSSVLTLKDLEGHFIVICPSEIAAAEIYP